MLSALEGNVTYLMTTFTQRLVAAFESNGSTRKALADVLVGPDGESGISVQAVGAQLNGKTKSMTAENLARAAKFLKVDAHWLATGEGSPGRAIQLPMDVMTRYLNFERDASWPMTNDQVRAVEEPHEYPDFVQPAAIGLAVTNLARVLLDLKGPRQAAAAALVRHLADNPRDYIEVMSELTRYVTDEHKVNRDAA